jgi:hypothetical protein
VSSNVDPSKKYNQSHGLSLQAIITSWMVSMGVQPHFVRGSAPAEAHSGRAIVTSARPSRCSILHRTCTSFAPAAP